MNFAHRLRSALLKTAELQKQHVESKAVLKNYQSAKLRITHAASLANPQTKQAAEFFLTEIYGTNSSLRVSDLERFIPSMEKILPASALETITTALELQALSEEMDTKMAAILGTTFTDAEYDRAFEFLGERDSQLDMIESVGNSLAQLVRIPFISGTLKMMRLPAKIAGIEQLHNFIERGFNTFKMLPDAKSFVSDLVGRERVDNKRKFCR